MAGLGLVVGALVAVGWASSPWSATYAGFWSHRFHEKLLGSWTSDPRDWVDSGAMTIFFLAVGLEMARERSVGLLSHRRHALLPVVAAGCGMALAAAAYLCVAHSGPASRGWGVPMATDIAFVAGAAGLLSKQLHPELRLLLLGVAVADDIGSVTVLAVVSGEHLVLWPLLLLVGLVAGLIGLRRWSATSWPAMACVVPAWILLASAHIEPALAGVVAGALVPAAAYKRSGSSRPDGRAPHGDRRSRLAIRSEQQASWVSAAVVLPVFALANTGVDLRVALLASPGALAVFSGILLARIVGKTSGVSLGAVIAGRSMTRSDRRAAGAPLRATGQMVGASALTGMGFTVPLLFARVAFSGRPHLFAAAQAGLLAGSVASAVLGAGVLLLLGALGRKAAQNPG